MQDFKKIILNHIFSMYFSGHQLEESGMLNVKYFWGLLEVICPVWRFHGWFKQCPWLWSVGTKGWAFLDHSYAFDGQGPDKLLVLVDWLTCGMFGWSVSGVWGLDYWKVCKSEKDE